MPRSGTMVGATLGNYRIVGPLSAGGMGRVFRAQHQILGRPAAVKLLRPELSGNDELVQRFFNEAKAATAIKHPGIVEVYDFGYTQEGHAYIVMEFLEGKPLGRALAKVGRFTEHEAATIARGIASALKAAHTKGIIHRDLKPDNIFLEPDLEGPTGATRAKVLDFGVAKLANATESQSENVLKTQAGILLGTPVYMAPEQARAAADIDHRADLYSLGCILYELIVGRPPFVADGAGEIIAMHLFMQPEPPSAIVEDISPEMERLVLRLLAKDPAERLQTAGEVVHALDAMGARLSAELSPTAPTSAVMRNLDLQSSGARAKLHQPPSLSEQAPTMAVQQRSSLPIIAGTATILIAIGIIVFALAARGGSDDEPNVEPTTPAPSKVGPTLKPETSSPLPTPPKPEVKETTQVPAQPPPRTPPRKGDRQPDRTRSGSARTPTVTKQNHPIENAP